MKLHLPKQLFTALLAVITLTTDASGAIEKETVSLYINPTTGEITTEATGDFTATNVTMLTGSASNGMASSNLTTNAGDTLLGFQLTNTTATAAESTSWFNGTQTITQDILIYDHDTTDNTKEGLIITNGNSGNVITFAGTVWGNGDFWKRNAPTAHFTFSGDMSKYSGNMTIEGGAITLKFYHNQSGTGTITSTAGTVEVVDATMNNASINAANLKVAGYYTTNSLFSGDVTATNLTIESGATATINGALTLSGTVTLAEAITANGTVTLGSNVVFNISGLSMNKDNTYTLFNGNSTVDLTNCQVVGVAGWTYTGQANGTVLATHNGKTLNLNGDNDDSTIFEWATGTSFSEGGEFATYDNVNITGTDKIKLTESVTASRVIVGAEGDTETIATFTDDSLALIVSQGLIIEKGATVEINKSTGGTGFIRGEVTVENGGVLRFNKKDVTGYNGGANSTHTINIHAGGELQLALDVSDNNETFAGILNLDGTLKGVTTSHTPTWDLYGGKAVINVSDNAQACTENVNFRLRQDNSTIYVGSNATLTHNGNISRNNNEGNGVLYKRGSGNLIVGGNVTLPAIYLTDGSMSLQGTSTITTAHIAKDTSLTLGNGTTQSTHSIGTLSATDASVMLNNGTVLALGANTHSIGTLTAANATVTLGENATLTLNGGTTEKVVKHSIGTLNGGAGSVLNLAAHATLSSISSFEGSVTLSGEGSYHLGATDTLNSAISLHTTDWKGSLVYSNKARDKDLINKLNDLANESANDTLVVSGAAGYIEGGTADKKLSADIKLENPTGGSALTVVNGNSDKTAYITGKVSGTGDFVFKPSGYSNYGAWSWAGVTYEFTGSVKDWNGNIIYQSTSNEENDVLTITFSNAATEIYANIINNNVVDAEHGITSAATRDKLAVKISNSKNVNVHGTINADEVTIANSADTSFHSTVNTSKVVLNSAATITKASDNKELAMTNAKLNSTSISSADTTGMTKGSISDADIAIAQLAQDASFTIQDMTLTNTTITAATAETRVNLNNVSASNLVLATGKFTMNAAPVVGLGGTEATFNTGVSSMAAGAATLTLNLDMMGAYESTGAVSGATLTITLGVSGADFSSYTVENWKALVGFDGWLGTMLENQNATYQVADGAAAVSEGASAPAVSYGYAAGGGGGNVGTLVITISGLNVPEPTTSTLSLLALAALAARRRRK